MNRDVDLQTSWDPNGQKRKELNYKDDEIVTAVAWKPNGEKCPDTNVVNGNGVRVWYNEDGTEKATLTDSSDTEEFVGLALSASRAVYKKTPTSGANEYHSIGIDGTGDNTVASELSGTVTYYGISDNRVIATHSHPDGNLDIASVPVTGGSATVIASESEKETPEADFMTQGLGIYQRYRGSFGNDLYVVPAIGGEEGIPLVEDSGDDSFAAYLEKE